MRKQSSGFVSPLILVGVLILAGLSLAYVISSSLVGTPSSQTAQVGGSLAQVNGGNQLAAVGSMANIVVDSSSPGTVKSNAKTLTTSSFAPPAGSTLYVLVALNSNAASGQQNSLTALTDNLGTHLNFVRQAAYGSENSDDALVYLYTAPVTTSQSMTISATQSTSQSGSSYAMLKVLVVTGANSSQPVGAKGGGRGIAGALSGTYTATTDNSLGWLLYADWNAKDVPTAGSNQSLFDSYTISGQDTYAISRQNSPSTSGSSVTMNTTAPTSGAQTSYLYFEMVPAVVMLPAPAISGVSASAITTSGATINWATDQQSDSQVEYGLTTAYGSNSALDSSLVTSHSVSLSGLQANTVYYYRVDSTNSQGTQAKSSDLTLTTSQTVVSNPPTNNPPAVTGQTLLNSRTPAITSNTDGSGVNYELGTSFKSTAPGQILAIRFYKSARETGTHTGHIWNSSGSLLASVTFTGETSSGWQQQTLPSPVSVSANAEYMVSVNTGNSYYVDTNNGFSSPITSGTLSSSGPGHYGPVGSYPTTTWQSSNYFRDIVFNQTGGVVNPPSGTVYTLTVTKAGTGTGTISGGTVSSCSSTCAQTNISAGTSMALTATPAANTTVTWIGCTSYSGNTCNVTVNSNATVTATFTTTVVTTDNVPTVPTNLRATAVSASEIDLSWNASTDTDSTPVAGYDVYSCQGASCNNFTLIANVTAPVATSFKNTGLTANTTYRYVVAAYDTVTPIGTHISAQSSPVSATTAASGGGGGTNPPVSTFTITPSISGTGGTISPSSATTVTSGANQSFTITPSTGYQVGSVLVDGAAVTSVAATGGTYTFTGVTTIHTISATFTATTVTSGNTYYVNSAIGNDSNAGTASAPWKTLTASVPKLKAGNTLIVTGTINEPVGANFTVSGTAASPITIQGQNATIDIKSGNTGDPVGNYTFNGNYIVIEGFTITGPSPIYMGGAFNVNGSHITVTNNTFQGLSGSTAISSGDDLVIINNNGSYNTYSNNTITANKDGDLFRFWGHDNLITHNTITNNTNPNYGVSSLHADLIQMFGCTASYDNVFEDNVVMNESISGGMLADWDATGAVTCPTVVHDWVFRNNIFANNSQQAMQIAIPNIHYYNNIFYNWRIGSYVNQQYGIVFFNGDYGPTGQNNGTKFYNNVFYQTGMDFPYGTSGVSNFLLDYNSLDSYTAGALWNVASYFGSHNTTITSDLGFVNAAAGDFHLTATSPLRGKGTNLSSDSYASTVDKDGVARPATGAWDIGPYQYTGTGTVTPPVTVTPPSAPTSLVATPVSSTQINLSWTASVVGTNPVTGYHIYVNGATIPAATVTTASYNSTGLTAKTAYSYGVTAVDSAGNESGKTMVSNTTLIATTPPVTVSGQTTFTTQTPTIVGQDDGMNYELGTQFQSNVAGQITAIRFWKDSHETGAHTGRIWSSSGQQLASAVFANETASGWQTQSLSSPLNISANTTYIVSVNTTNDYYVTTNYGLSSAITSGNLTAPVSGGVYVATPGSLPTTTYDSRNYFRDVVFNPTGTTPSPTTYTITASAGSNGTITPSGATTVTSGASQSFTVTPSTGYQVGSVLVDGAAVTSVAATGGTYTFTGVTAIHTISAAFTATTITSNGSTIYVRSGATGNGSSWANAYGSTANVSWSSLPSNATVCIAAGSYSGFSFGSSGTTVKRAAATDPTCGSTSSGWTSTYDGLVTINGSIVLNSNTTIDGLSTTALPYGIKLNYAGGTKGMSFPAAAASSITIRAMELVGPGYSYSGSTCTSGMSNEWTGTYPVTNLLISHSSVHDSSELMFLRNVSNSVIEYTQLYNSATANSTACHPNGVYVGGGSNNDIFRYNNMYGMSAEGLYFGEGGSNWYVYGNVMHDSWPSSTGRGIEFAPASGADGAMYIWNNTIANFAGYVGIRYAANVGAGSQFYNNLLYNASSDASGSNNLSVSTAGSFANVSNMDYRLAAGSAAINAGKTLTTDGYINKDMNGNTRGADGTWDVGAYEYTGTVVNPTSFIITSSVSGTGGAISPSGQVTVTSGANQSFTITPSSGYQVSSVLVDGAAVTSVAATGGTYTFTGVTAAHTISVAFTAVANPPASGTVFYVSPSGAGSKNGADWNNAMAWSSMSFTRGATYYLAGGQTYAAKTLSTAASGSTLVSILKATSANSGNIAGWQSSYGSQATLGAITIASSYWTIDGQTGAGFSVNPPDETPSDYGFAFNGIAKAITPSFSGSSITDITVRHVYAMAPSGDIETGFFYKSTSLNTAVNNLTISSSLFDGWQVVVWIGTDTAWKGLLYEYNISLNANSTSNHHGSSIDADAGPLDGPIFRYNYWRGGTGTALIEANNHDISNMAAYGNVFDSYDGSRIIGNGSQGDYISNSVSYNNTFLNSPNANDSWFSSALGGESAGPGGNIGYNNLLYNMPVGHGQGTTYDYNAYFSTTNTPSESHGQIGTGNPFVNSAAHNYQLNANTNAGTALGSPYNVDALGHIRTTWTRGAFEYTGTIVNPPAADQTAPVVTFTIPSTSTSLTVNFTTFSATDAVGVTGYMVNETSAAPLATASGWTTTPSVGYVFTTTGAHTLYAWAKDAAGNVSASKSASVAITIPVTTNTITASAGSNGTITPSGATVVNSGANQSFTITPSTGYQVSSVLVDNAAVTSVAATGGTYTFTSVLAAHTISVAFTATTVSGTTVNVTPSTWANQTFVRGNTYVLAPGTYPGRTLNTPASGSSVITIKGSGSGQVTFTSLISFGSGYWTLDGVTGAGASVNPPDTNPADYGFVSTAGSQVIGLSGAGIAVPNITVKHFYAKATTADTEKMFAEGYMGGGSYEMNNFTMSYSLLDGWQGGFMTRGQGSHTYSGLLWEYNILLNGYSSSVNHGEWVNPNEQALSGAIIRYNIFKGQTGSSGETGVIVANNSANTGAQIYGNVFDSMRVGNGIISGTSAGNMSNAVVYNNTFLNATSDSGPWVNGPGSGNVAKNNLIYNMPSSAGTGWTVSSNQSFSSNPFISTTLGDLNSYALNAQTNSADTSVPAQYRTDMYGNVGTSIGAVQYTGTVTNPTPDTTAPVVTFTIPSTSSSLTVNFTTFSATDAVGVTGYMVSESATAPLATATGWTTTPSTGYVFASAGSKTLYAWAKDAAGNVSAGKTASVVVTVTTSSVNTYYMATTGSDSNAGTLASPWLSLSTSLGKMKGGDTLYIRGGTYNGIVDIYGPSGLSTSSPTTIKAYNGEAVIFKGTGTSSGSDSINGVNHFVIDGITYTNFNIGFIVQTVNDVTIRNSTVHDVGQQGWFVHSNSSYVTLDHDTVYNTGLLTNENGEGIYIGTSASSAPYDNTNNIAVTNNTVYNTADEGIELKNASYKILVDGNTFTNDNNANNSFGLGGGAIEINQSGGYNANPQDIIRNNVVSNTPIGIRVDTGATVYNNIVYGASKGIQIDKGDSYTRNVYFNTVDATAANALVNNGTNEVVKNNLGPSLTGNMASNAAFYVSQASHDYHLVAGSAAINSGTAITGITTDKDGVTRASSPSMGAYEYTGTTVTDQTAPVVTAFTIPATSNSLTVNFTTFTATDAVGVTGYLVTETSAAPLATASGWTTTPSTGYVFTSTGSKTLYAWAKDAAGNVSTTKSAAVTVTVIAQNGISCDQATVQNAINAAATGATITCNAGSWTWGSQITLSKNITLKGAGNGSSVTTVTSNIGRTIIMGAGNRITGFTFKIGSPSDSTDDLISATVGTAALRIDNNVFDARSSNGFAIDTWGNGPALIDHNTFYDENAAINPFGNGDASWSSPSAIGTGNQVYIEDNSFVYTNPALDGALDSYDGAKWVFRHNTVSGVQIGSHGLDSGGFRSTFSEEVYNNTFDLPGTATWDTVMNFRGGSGVVFNNTFTGHWNTTIKLQNYRSSDNYTSSVGNSIGSICNGTASIDGNTAGWQGWPCKDQIGRSTNQTSDPFYAWNNTINGQPANAFASDVYNSTRASTYHILSGRDFFNGTPKPGYTPFTYPYPLAANGMPL